MQEWIWNIKLEACATVLQLKLYISTVELELILKQLRKIWSVEKDAPRQPTLTGTDYRLQRNKVSYTFQIIDYNTI